MRLGTWGYQCKGKHDGCLLVVYHLFKTKHSAVITYGFNLAAHPTSAKDIMRESGKVRSHCVMSDQNEEHVKELAENWIRTNLFEDWEPPTRICSNCGREMIEDVSNICSRCGAAFREPS